MQSLNMKNVAYCERTLDRFFDYVPLCSVMKRKLTSTSVVMAILNISSTFSTQLDSKFGIRSQSNSLHANPER